MGNLFNVYSNYYFIKIIIRGVKKHMNRKLAIIITALTILIVLSTSTISTSAIKQQSTRNLSPETLNRQVYLGFANILGNGSNSKLETIAENDLAIKIDSQGEYIDFYINYDMNCSGTTDEGIITLAISINGQNITPNIMQTPTSKNGTLKIENVEVQRQDTLVFVIYAAYGSIIPLYSNSTSDSGAGVFNKGITVVEKSTNQFLDFLEQHLRVFPILKYLLSL